MSTISASTTTTTAYKVTADTTGVLTLQTGATPTTAMTIDTSQNVGVGTASPVGKLNVRSTYVSDTTTQLRFQDNTGVTLDFGGTAGGVKWLNVKDVSNNDAYPLAFQTGSTERARIDASGNLLVGTTSTSWTSGGGAGFVRESSNRSTLICATTSTSGLALAAFINPNGTVGTIQTSGTSTSYVTSSDYRLKEDVSPMTGALAKVSALKPVTYKWKADGSDGEGFIAHELAEVCPQAVVGEKDAVDEDGNPVHQGIDTSFLVATLVAAIQELKAEIDTLKGQA